MVRLAFVFDKDVEAVCLSVPVLPDPPSACMQAWLPTFANMRRSLDGVTSRKMPLATVARRNVLEEPSVCDPCTPHFSAPSCNLISLDGRSV